MPARIMLPGHRTPAWGPTLHLLTLFTALEQLSGLLHEQVHLAPALRSALHRLQPQTGTDPEH